MAKEPEVIQHSLLLNEHMDLHRKGWRVQPFGLAILVSLMLAGLLGLFGNGWMSNRTTEIGTTKVQYQKFARLHSNLQLGLTTSIHRGQAIVSFPLQYLKAFEVKNIVPEPTSSFIKEDKVWYVFAANQAMQTQFFLRPEIPGIVSGTIQVNNQIIPLHHFIYP